jgi:hypothetical protein
MFVLFFDRRIVHQCVLGTLVDAYFRGYDCIVLEDGTGTTSPEGGFENVIYNAGGVSLRKCIPNQMFTRLTFPLRAMDL